MSRFVFLFVAVGLWTAVAQAVETAIEWPRLGFPRVVIPGGLLEFSASGEGTLSLERAGQVIPLDATWSPSGATERVGRSVVPTGTSPGRYTLQLAGEDGLVARKGAVHVLEEFPEEYAIAIVRGVRSDAADRSMPVIPPDLGTRLSAESVQLAILLGPLSQHVSEAEYQALEATLLASEVPVYLCPDATEMRSPGYRAYFGDRVHGVSFGRDGYIFLGDGLLASDPQTHARLGEAHRLRRALRASRWTVGVASAYALDWDLRAQVALFVDDPLNFLIAGAAPPELGATVPWGKTQLGLPTIAPPALLTVLDVTETGIRPRPQPEATETPAEAAPASSDAQAFAAE